MGYTTTFEGAFDITPSLNSEEYETLINFSKKRHGFQIPDQGMPGFWCQWIPNKNGNKLKWDGGEKFYNYDLWLEYLITTYFIPWNKQINGKVEWFGEENIDIGIIEIKNNVMKVKRAKLVVDD